MARIHLHVQRPKPVRLSVGGLMFDRAADYWDGAYIVVPGVDGQELATEGYRMAHDFEVTAIPYLTTTNEAGGMTATIAS